MPSAYEPSNNTRKILRRKGVKESESGNMVSAKAKFAIGKLEVATQLLGAGLTGSFRWLYKYGKTERPGGLQRTLFYHECVLYVMAIGHAHNPTTDVGSYNRKWRWMQVVTVRHNDCTKAAHGTRKSGSRAIQTACLPARSRHLYDAVLFGSSVHSFQSDHFKLLQATARFGSFSTNFDLGRSEKIVLLVSSVETGLHWSKPVSAGPNRFQAVYHVWKRTRETLQCSQVVYIVKDRHCCELRNRGSTVRGHATKKMVTCGPEIETWPGLELNKRMSL